MVDDARGLHLRDADALADLSLGEVLLEVQAQDLALARGDRAQQLGERGAVLCGAVEALRAHTGYRIQRLELKVITETREALKSRLGDRFYELESRGAELELDDAVALALES